MLLVHLTQADAAEEGEEDREALTYQRQQARKKAPYRSLKRGE